MFDDAVGEFPLTQWSLVRGAKAADAQSRRNALSILLHRYIPALRAHLRADRRIADDLVDDLLQGFIADKVVEENLLAKAEQSRGKFRTFLLVTLDRYVVSQHRKSAAAKRSPEQLLAFDGDVQARPSNDPVEQFNMIWARETIAEALRRMEADCAVQQRGDVWTIFHARIIAPLFDGIEPMPYELLVKKLNLASPLQACNLLTTAKRTFSRHLLGVAAEYSSNETEARDEVNQLREILAGLRAESV
jgi:DNA-directed RNA polymerase specialized sigma24 family protein